MKLMIKTIIEHGITCVYSFPVRKNFCRGPPVLHPLFFCFVFVLFLIIAFIFQRNGKQNRNRSFYRDLHFYKTLFRNRKVINRKYVDDSACQALTWSPKPKSHVEKQLTASTRFSSARNRDEACFQSEVFSL